ncbi:MAG: hypothetical protein NXH95_00690 [Pseudomonadaceae bacterium]|nr:hypothetical protein [Pseudomonadaceae bacterium]
MVARLIICVVVFFTTLNTQGAERDFAYLCSAEKVAVVKVGDDMKSIGDAKAYNDSSLTNQIRYWVESDGISTYGSAGKIFDDWKCAVLGDGDFPVYCRTVGEDFFAPMLGYMFVNDQQRFVIYSTVASEIDGMSNERIDVGRCEKVK